MYTLLSLFILVFLLYLSGFFSSSETALFSLSSMKIKAYQKSPDKRRHLIAQLLMKPRDLLVTVFMLNTLVNILLQNVISHAAGERAGWGLKVGVPLLLTLVFGEIIPKYIGLQNNMALSYHVIPTISFLQNLIKPLRKITIAITSPISKFFFFFLKKEESFSKEEMLHALETSEKYGILHTEETELIKGYLLLQDTTVKKITRPREDMLYYTLEEPLTKLIHLFVDKECTRVPICDKNIENIYGVISAKAFFLHQESFQKPNDLLRIAKKPFFVPETTSARNLIRRLDENQEVMAIVVDEYGSIEGLVTREDLVELVVGEIIDLRDQQLLYTKAGKNEIITSGKLELSEFNHLFESDLSSSNNMVTIGGWLIEQMGTIPKSGTTYEIENFLFQVLSSEPNRINRIYIRKKVKRGQQ